MNEIYESLDRLRYQRDAVEVWWGQQQKQFSPDQQDALFNWVIEDKFNYLPIVTGLTLDTAETVTGLAANLERLSPYIDRDLAWADFFNALETNLSGNVELARKLYHELPAETQAWPRKYIGIIMAELPDDEGMEEILRLLRSRDLDKVDVGVRGLVIGFRDEEVPSEAIDELIQLAEDSTFHEKVLQANAALFKANPELWDLTLDIGRNNPSNIQGVINLYGRRVEREHLPAYIELIELGLEEDTTEYLHIEHLYLDFADETELLADFAVILSEHQLSTAKQLVEQVADRQDDGEILPALFQWVGEFPSAFHGTEMVFAAGKHSPRHLVPLIINRYEDSQRLAMLELMKKVIGELFNSTTYDRQTAIDIADFLETVNGSSFIRPLNRELIEEEPDDGEADNKDVYYHLYGVISDHLDNRNYDLSTLNLLNEYPNLKSHFHAHLTQKVERTTYHPMLNLLQNEAHTHLQFLDDNWARIPASKQQQLLGEAFDSTLSEIGLLLWLDDRGFDFDIDVNLHAHDTGEELDKDIDVVVDRNYIEIRAPKTWRNLEVANQWIGIPNTAYDKIAGKFKSDYAGTAELSQEQIFIALDITTSEISPEEVISSLYGAMKIQLTYDTETGETIDDRPIRDPEDSLQGWPLLDDNLNGVIWYTAQINENTEGVPRLQVEGDVVPNPHHQDENNYDYCTNLHEDLFGD